MNDFDRFRDPIRNNLAHGDWSDLAQELHALDLTKAFLGVARFYVSIAYTLRAMGYQV